jgi:FkbM family methyltransferase
MTSELSFRDRTNLFVSNIAGRLHLDSRVPVALSEEDGLTLVRIPNREIAIPAARRWHRYKRGWDRRTARLLFQFGVGDVVNLHPGDTVIDIGANIGEFTLGVAALGVNVHAIEGDPHVFRCLMRNCMQSPNVNCHQNVVWKEDTRLTFYSEPTDADSSVFKPDAGVASTALEVDARSLDSIAFASGIDQVAFLKCDAEGAEPEVIEGGRDLLSRTRAVAFDTGAERMGEETSEESEALLRELGFKVHHDRRPNRKITFGIRN